MKKAPSYSGSGLVNLVAELEWQLTGASVAPRLSDDSQIPEASTYVLVLFDGLGTSQLDHHDAAPFRTSLAGSIDSPFPSMTNVSLSTIASGLVPAAHGQIAHMSWFPDLDQVVNTLKWVTPSGEPVAYDYGGLLPRPNLWERLRAAGVEPITVQPGDFQTSPLTRQLYRGARFEGAWSERDLAEATVALAASGRRLIFTYVPFVDFAGHVFGTGSDEFTDAMKLAATIWEDICAGLPPGAVVIGTADHGLLDVAESDKILIREPHFDDLRFAGDPRGVALWGDPTLMDDLAAATGGDLIDPAPFYGPDLSDLARAHLAPRMILPPGGKIILPKAFDKRLRAYHGGLSRAELEIPVLVG